MLIKKTLALVTLTCYLFSFVCCETLRAALDGKPSLHADSAAHETFVIPADYGRITGGKYLGSRQIVINIQDLHCHPGIQRNIAGILAALDGKYGLDSIYVEGGYGAVDTSRLCAIQDGEIRKDVLESLLDQGALTGGEYYSVVSRKPGILKGLEEESVHKANLVRLGRILQRRGAYRQTLREMKKDLSFMKAKYLGPENRRLNALVEKYRAGRLPADRYYRLLFSLVKRINANPDLFNHLGSIRTEQYGNIRKYSEAARISKRLRTRAVSRQFPAFMQFIRENVPYNTYNAILARTDGSAQNEEFCLRLAAVIREHRLPVETEFPELARFFDTLALSADINPLELVAEEKRLIEEIRVCLSRDVRELEVSFIDDFFACFSDFMLNALTPADYAYFNRKFESFSDVWGKYARGTSLPALAKDIELLNEFYAANCQRNECFLSNIDWTPARHTGSAAPLRFSADPLSGSRLDEALEASDILVVITGGFHSEGLKELLERRKVSYLVVTPGSRDGAAGPRSRYEELALQQADFLTQSLALGLASQLSSPLLFELAVRAANRRLADAPITDKMRLFEELKKATGIEAVYDAEHGTILFANGSRIQLEEKDGSMQVRGLSPAGFVSAAVQASFQSLLDLEELASALARSDVQELMEGLMLGAAGHDLFLGDGLIYELENDEGLKVRLGETLADVSKLPEPVQRAIAQRERRLTELEEASGRAAWLKILLAVDLLRDLLAGSSAHAAHCTICGGRELTNRFYLEGKYAVVECDGCGLMFMKNPPDENRLAEIFSENYYSSDHPRVGYRDYAAQEEIRLEVARSHVDYLKHRGVSGGRILEVGPAAGYFLKQARDAGWEVAGVDRNPGSAKMAYDKFGLEIRTGRLEDVTFGEPINAAVMFDVLGHTSDPRGVLERIHGLLDDNGALLIRTPDIGSPEAGTLGIALRELSEEHLFYFTRASLTELLNRCGFEVIEIGTDDEVRAAAGTSFSAQVQERIDRIKASRGRRDVHMTVLAKKRPQVNHIRLKDVKRILTLVPLIVPVLYLAGSLIPEYSRLLNAAIFVPVLYGLSAFEKWISLRHLDKSEVTVEEELLSRNPFVRAHGKAHVFASRPSLRWLNSPRAELAIHLLDVLFIPSAFIEIVSFGLSRAGRSASAYFRKLRLDINRTRHALVLARRSTGSWTEAFAVLPRVTEWQRAMDAFIDHPGQIHNYEERVLTSQWVQLKKGLLGEYDLLPFSMEITPTGKCNLNCIHCIGKELGIKAALQSDKLDSALTPAVMRRLINDIRETNRVNPWWGVTGDVKLSGIIGEPLMEKDTLVAGLEELGRTDIKTGLFTNGVLLNDETVMRALVDNADYVLVGVSGEPVFRKQSIDNIRALSELRNATPGTRLAVNVGVVIARETYRDIAMIAYRVKDAGADSIRFRIDIAPEADRKLTEEEYAEVMRQLELARELADNSFKVEVTNSDEEIAEGLERPDYTRCWFADLYATVDHNGRVMMCQYRIATDEVIGNVNGARLEDLLRNGGGLKKTFSPADSCPSCPPFPRRINRMSQYLHEQHEAHPWFLDWVEAAYVIPLLLREKEKLSSLGDETGVHRTNRVLTYLRRERTTRDISSYAFKKSIRIVIPTALPRISSYIRAIRVMLDALINGNFRGGKYFTELSARLKGFLKLEGRTVYPLLSGSDALALIIQALKLGRDGRDEVIVPSFVFRATVDSLRMANLKPVFVDIDPETLNADPGLMESLITEKTCAILVVDNYGLPCDYARIDALAKERNLKFIIDSAESFGATSNDTPIGHYGDGVIVSFSFGKVVHSGGAGGALIVPDSLAVEIKADTNYLQPLFGSRIMPELNAAILLEFIDRMPAYLANRKAVAEIYRDELGDLPGIAFQEVPAGLTSVTTHFPLIIDPRKFLLTRDELKDQLAALNVQSKEYFPAQHLQGDGSRTGLPLTEHAAANVLCLPVASDMQPAVARQIARAVRAIHHSAANDSLRLADAFTNHRKQVLNAIAILFGVDEDKLQDKEQKALKVYHYLVNHQMKHPKVVRDILGIVRSPVPYTNSNRQRFMPLACAAANMLARERRYFLDEALLDEVVAAVPELEYLKKSYPLFVDPEGLDEKMIAGYTPVSKLIQPLPDKKDYRWLDIGSAPKNEGAPTLRVLNAFQTKYLPEIGKSMTIYGTDAYFPHYAFDWGRGEIVPSIFRRDNGFISTGRIDIEGVMYLDAGRPENDVMSDNLASDTFDFISACKVFHYLSKPGEEMVPGPLAAGVVRKNESLKEFIPEYYATETQRKTIARLLSRLSPGGILFLEIPLGVGLRRDNRNGNHDAFMVIQRLDDGSFCLYEDVIPFQPDLVPFNSYLYPLGGAENCTDPVYDNPGIASLLPSGAVKAREELPKLLAAADMLVYRHQKLNNNAWVVMRAAVAAIQQKKTLFSAFSEYLSYVPEENPIKTALLQRVHELEVEAHLPAIERDLHALDLPGREVSELMLSIREALVSRKFYLGRRIAILGDESGTPLRGKLTPDILTKETKIIGSLDYVAAFYGRFYVPGSEVLCSMPDGRIVSLRRATNPAKDTYTYPSGMVDYGDDFDKTAVKETIEELGLNENLECRPEFHSTIIKDRDGFVNGIVKRYRLVLDASAARRVIEMKNELNALKKVRTREDYYAYLSRLINSDDRDGRITGEISDIQLFDLRQLLHPDIQDENGYGYRIREVFLNEDGVPQDYEYVYYLTPDTLQRVLAEKEYGLLNRERAVAGPVMNAGHGMQSAWRAVWKLVFPLDKLYGMLHLRDASDAERKTPALAAHHIVESKDLGREIRRYQNSPGFGHLWFSELSDRSGEGLSPVDFKVRVDGASRPVDVWAGAVDGAGVFFMDLRKAGVPAAGHGQALSQGAAQIIVNLSGTDAVKPDEHSRQRMLAIWRLEGAEAAAALDRRPVIVIDHTGGPQKTRVYFSDVDIQNTLVVPGDLLDGAPVLEIDAVIRKTLAKHNAQTTTMGENKILKMDTADLDEFTQSLGLFNAVGNGQMLVDWEVFERALAGQRVTEDQVRDLLKNARAHGVLIHCGFRANDDTKGRDIGRLFDLGFQGVSLDLSRLDAVRARRLMDEAENFPLLAVVTPPALESPAPLVRVSLPQVKGMQFNPSDVIDVEIPAGMSIEALRDHFAHLPLANTMIFHSKDVREIIGATRDIIDKNAFASILRLLVSFGRSSIETPEKARRLGYNYGPAELPELREGEEGRRQIAALTSGSLEGSGIAMGSALHEQAQELAVPALKKAFLQALAERLLIKAELLQANPELGRAYVRGTYRFSTPLQEELLGTALLRRSLLTPREASLDIEAAQALKDGVSENVQSFLQKEYDAIRAGKTGPGSLTAVIDIILLDLVFDFRLRKDFTEKRGTLDLRTVNRILQAA